MAFGGRGLTRGVAFGGRGLIRGVAFGGRGLIRGVAFGGRGLIRGVVLYLIICKKVCGFRSQSRYEKVHIVCLFLSGCWISR